MQITNNIEIVCSVCGAPMPTETNIGREHDRNLWVFRVMPCVRCAVNKKIEDGAEYACWLDVNCSDREGTDPHCVLDDNRPDDCLFTEKGMIKEECQYWRAKNNPIKEDQMLDKRKPTDDQIKILLLRSEIARLKEQISKAQAVLENPVDLSDVYAGAVDQMAGGINGL